MQGVSLYTQPDRANKVVIEAATHRISERSVRNAVGGSLSIREQTSTIKEALKSVGTTREHVDKGSETRDRKRDLRSQEEGIQPYGFIVWLTKGHNQKRACEPSRFFTGVAAKISDNPYKGKETPF